jgi:hypothetical protein
MPIGSSRVPEIERSHRAGDCRSHDARKEDSDPYPPQPGARTRPQQWPVDKRIEPRPGQELQRRERFHDNENRVRLRRLPENREL